VSTLGGRNGRGIPGGADKPGGTAGMPGGIAGVDGVETSGDGVAGKGSAGVVSGTSYGFSSVSSTEGAGGSAEACADSFFSRDGLDSLAGVLGRGGSPELEGAGVVGREEVAFASFALGLRSAGRLASTGLTGVTVRPVRAPPRRVALAAEAGLAVLWFIGGNPIGLLPQAADRGNAANEDFSIEIGTAKGTVLRSESSAFLATEADAVLALLSVAFMVCLLEILSE